MHAARTNTHIQRLRGTLAWTNVTKEKVTPQSANLDTECVYEPTMSSVSTSLNANTKTVGPG